MAVMSTTAAAVAPRRWGRHIHADRLFLLLPIAVLYGLLMLAPLSFILETSFSTGLDHYRGVLATPVLWKVIENTVVISATTTLVALILAYIYAAALWRAGPLLRILLLGLVLLPFWTG